MKLTVLCDNNTYIDNYLLGEPAYSVYIENGKDKILFDVGYSDVYKNNAKLLNIDLTKVNKIALSHGHNDHTQGLKFLPKGIKPTIYYVANSFEEKYANGLNISAPYTINEMKRKYEMVEVSKPIEISRNLFVLGPIPRTQKFELINTELMKKENGCLCVDEMHDDTALCYNGADGLVIITGCSHSGICNICEYAKLLFKKEIKVVIGGFHLLSLSNQAKQTIKYFAKQNNVKLYPCHCTSLHVKAKMINSKLDISEVGSGLVLTF